MRPKSTAAYSVLPNGDLRRTTTKLDGGKYLHHCSKRTFETIAIEFDQVRTGLTMPEIAQRLELPYTQVNVAMEFLKDRGVIVVQHRRKSTPASHFCFEDAMIEYQALLSRCA
jgi:hypothetical protein